MTHITGERLITMSNITRYNWQKYFQEALNQKKNFEMKNSNECRLISKENFTSILHFMIKKLPNEKYIICLILKQLNELMDDPNEIKEIICKFLRYKIQYIDIPLEYGNHEIIQLSNINKVDPLIDENNYNQTFTDLLRAIHNIIYRNSNAPEIFEAYHDYDLGVDFLKDEKPSYAIDYFKKSIKKFDEDPRFYIKLGLSLSKLNYPDNEIIALYEKAISLSPNFYRPYYDLGNIYVRLKNKKKAVSYYKKSLSLNPNHLHSKYALANLKGMIDISYIIKIAKINITHTIRSKENRVDTKVRFFQYPGIIFSQLFHTIMNDIFFYMQKELNKTSEVAGYCSICRINGIYFEVGAYRKIEVDPETIINGNKGFYNVYEGGFECKDCGNRKCYEHSHITLDYRFDPSEMPPCECGNKNWIEI